jgi:hypothetical protein
MRVDLKRFRRDSARFGADRRTAAHVGAHMSALHIDAVSIGRNKV